MSSDDSKDAQYEFDVTLKDNDSRLILNIRDKKNLRKFTNSYNAATLAAKGLTQPLDKLAKILKTAATAKNKDNWSITYGYFNNPNKKSSKKRDEEMDLMPSYLSKTNISQLRNKPKRDDTLFLILAINEDFFTIDTQFKLYEIDKPKAIKKRNRTSSISKIRGDGTTFDIDAEQKFMDMEAKIKSLSRDNQVLKRKIEKLESTSGKKQKKMDNEREMRLQANKERFWLKQKLDRLQKAIAARLKILGVDFSKVDDITSALDMAFNVIQKLAKELEKKDEGFEEMKIKMNEAVKEKKDYRKNIDRLEGTIEKQRSVMHDLRKQLGERDKRLSIVAHERSDTESALTQQLKEIQNELSQRSNDKEKIFDELVDLKAKFKGEMDDKVNELDDIKNELNKSKEENGELLNENEEMKAEYDKLLNTNHELNAKLEEDNKEIEDLKHELETEKNKNVDLIENNKKMKQEIKRLLQDLTGLKMLMEKALNIEAQLKNALDGSSDLIGTMTSTEKELLQLIDD